MKIYFKAYVYLVFDNADSLKYFKDSANLFLMLCKLNEYLNIDTMETNEEDRINLCTLFITEQDWHSLISECDLMSRTEATRPFILFFNEYTKDQMKVILQKTAQSRWNEYAWSCQQRAVLCQDYSRCVLSDL